MKALVLLIFLLAFWVTAEAQTPQMVYVHNGWTNSVVVIVTDTDQRGDSGGGLVPVGGEWKGFDWAGEGGCLMVLDAEVYPAWLTTSGDNTDGNWGATYFYDGTTNPVIEYVEPADVAGTHANRIPNYHAYQSPSAVQMLGIMPAHATFPDAEELKWFGAGWALVMAWIGGFTLLKRIVVKSVNHGADV